MAGPDGRRVSDIEIAHDRYPVADRQPIQEGVIIVGTSEVVVGVDDSAESHAALRWALRYARMSGARIRAVRVFSPPLPMMGPDAVSIPAMAGPLLDNAERVAGDRLEGAVAECLCGAPPKDRESLSTWVEAGDATDVLLELSRRAVLLVLGNGHHGALGGAVTGSVALRFMRHTQCPLVLVPAEWGDAAPNDERPIREP